MIAEAPAEEIVPEGEEKYSPIPAPVPETVPPSPLKAIRFPWPAPAPPMVDPRSSGAIEIPWS